MKKSMLALAALTAFAGAASAQSSVTLFGVIDAGITRVSAGGSSTTGLSNSGNTTPRLGFRGVEDLGGGLKAGFWLEGGLNNDVGQGATQTTAFNFQRRSTVSLMGSFGEIRLGRDYVPTFLNTGMYEAFGFAGVATTQMHSLIGTAGIAGPNTSRQVRADNAISYFTPAMGGLFGQIQYGFGENANGGPKTNNYIGFRFGYAAGPMQVGVAYGKAEGSETAADKSSNDLKTTNVGGSYDFGMAKVMLGWSQEKAGSAKVNGIAVTAVAPVGAGEFKLTYARYDVKSSDNDWNKIGVGYVHNLSKRTALYATYARVSNKGAQTVTITGGNASVTAGAAAAGGSASGFDLGVRHLF